MGEPIPGPPRTSFSNCKSGLFTAMRSRKSSVEIHRVLSVPPRLHAGTQAVECRSARSPWPGPAWSPDGRRRSSSSADRQPESSMTEGPRLSARPDRESAASGSARSPNSGATINFQRRSSRLLSASFRAAPQFRWIFRSAHGLANIRQRCSSRTGPSQHAVGCKGECASGPCRVQPTGASGFRSCEHDASGFYRLRRSRALIPCRRLPRSKPKLWFVILRHGSPNLAVPVANLQPSIAQRSLIAERDGPAPVRRRHPAPHRLVRERK